MVIFSLKEWPRLSYLGLLLTFFIYFLITPLFPGNIGRLAIQISFSFMLLTAVFALGNRREMVIGGALAFISALANACNIYQDNFWTEFWSLTISLAFITFAALHLFREVFLMKIVEANLIFGSVCIYILSAMLWALLYGLIELLLPGSFQGALSFPEEGALIMSRRTQSFLYFSFVTQTTVGFGDITPSTPIAKNLVAIQATLGVFYLATLVGGLVNSLIKRK
jgi:hypothetical protein